MCSSGSYYRYLGIKQVFKPDYATVRECLTEAYTKRLRHIWCSALSAKHKVHTTNTWAMPLFRYFITQVRWLLQSLVQLD